jgi:hypothetical protein
VRNVINECEHRVFTSINHTIRRSTIQTPAGRHGGRQMPFKRQFRPLGGTDRRLPLQGSALLDLTRFRRKRKKKSAAFSINSRRRAPRRSKNMQMSSLIFRQSKRFKSNSIFSLFFPKFADDPSDRPAHVQPFNDPGGPIHLHNDLVQTTDGSTFSLNVQRTGVTDLPLIANINIFIHFHSKKKDTKLFYANDSNLICKCQQIGPFRLPIIRKKKNKIQFLFPKKFRFCRRNRSETFAS